VEFPRLALRASGKASSARDQKLVCRSPSFVGRSLAHLGTGVYEMSVGRNSALTVIKVAYGEIPQTQPYQVRTHAPSWTVAGEDGLPNAPAADNIRDVTVVSLYILPFDNRQLEDFAQSWKVEDLTEQYRRPSKDICAIRDETPKYWHAIGNEA
jgi:hypothetical protein